MSGPRVEKPYAIPEPATGTAVCGPQVPITQPHVGVLVDRWCQMTPDAVAVDDRGRPYTYRELRSRSRQFAGLLAGGSVPDDRPVILLLPRSFDLLAAVLGGWRAGRFFIPVDPDQPERRIASLLAQTGASHVVADSAAGYPVPAPTGARVVVVEEGTTGAPNLGAPQWAGADAPAYAIFTSGSTGMPKLAAVAHRSLANVVQWHNRTYALDASDRVSMTSSPGFDASVWEVWPCLAAGGSVYIPDDTVRTSPIELVGWLRDQRITVCFMVTALAESLLDLPDLREGSLRLLQVAGDRLRRFAPDDLPFRVMNHYGPTECTILATAGPVPRCSDAGRSAAPDIGRPIDNVRVMVVDEADRLVPAGVTGEVLIGGTGVGLGYLGQPELTRERFIADSWRGADGGRVYRTGDFARWSPAGALEFVGRRDDQVQLWGVRVDLGEVEAAIRTLDGVAEAAVVATGTGDGSAHALRAYVTLRPGAERDGDALRIALLDQLPRQIVPAEVAVLHRLPLNAAGKIDRAALRRRAAGGQPRPAAGARRRFDTILEASIARLWREILEVDVPDSETSFFQLGGNSMLASMLWARLTDRYDIPLTVSNLYQLATVRAQARAVSSWFAGEGHASLALHLADGPAPALVCVHGISGAVYYARNLGRVVRRRVIGVRAMGYEGEAEPLTDVVRMAVEYRRALHAQGVDGDVCVLGYCGPSVLALELARQWAAGSGRAHLVLVDPVLPEDMDEPDDDEALYRRQLGFVAGRAGLSTWRDDGPLPDARRRLLRLLHQVGVYPRSFTEDRFDRQMRVYLQLVKALRGYRPERSDLDSRLIVTREDLTGRYGGDPAVVRDRWSPILRDPRVSTVDVGHLAVLEGDAAASLVRQEMDRVAATAECEEP